MGTAYAEQLATKDARCRAALSSLAPQLDWLEPVASADSGFRNKAKLVVGGTPGAVTLGILDGDRRGVDLRRCGLHEPVVAQAIPLLADWIDDLRLLPYDVAKRRGELKHVLVTGSPAEELMVRVVLEIISRISERSIISKDSVLSGASLCRSLSKSLADLLTSSIRSCPAAWMSMLST